jgi:hypothetical protein
MFKALYNANRDFLLQVVVVARTRAMGDNQWFGIRLIDPEAAQRRG